MSAEKRTETVQLEYFENGIPQIVLGRKDERAISLTMARMDSLKEAILYVRNTSPKGLVISGPRSDMFSVGADISLIHGVTDAAAGEALAKRGQEVFDLIQSLPFPTIAAISGPCVGGACELALACTFRLISDDKTSMIGLPEVNLGILPGFGGTQRLPRLIGLPRSLDIILAGKTLRPKQAHVVGLVHEVVQTSRILERAESIAGGGVVVRNINIPFIDRLLTNTAIGRNIAGSKAAKSIRHKTKGFYPAPPAALKSVLYGLEHGQEAGLKYEAAELGRLIVSPECKALVNIFLLSQAANHVGKTARKDVENTNALIIGAGTMGAGIATVMAKNGCAVTLKDTSDDAITRGREHINIYLQKLKYLSETEKSFIQNRIETTTREVLNISSINVVVEAIFEDLGVKKRVFQELATQLSPDAIIASNTSSLSITKIAEGLPNPERVVGMHFFNPVEKMPLVEIIMGAQTSNKTIAVVAALISKLGKYPIVVHDVPGFLINRILTPYLNEAAFLVEEGYRVVDIDAAATAFGMPMGPLRLLDEIGLDVAAHVSDVMLNGYGDRMKAPQLAKKLSSHGLLGNKSGSGFYVIKGKDAQPNPRVQEILQIKSSKRDESNLLIQNRLIMALLNEGIRCLDEGVAGDPGEDSANQINLGTVMGFGFPPFRGGLLYYADHLGAKSIHETMTKLQREHGPRFEPWKGITERAARNGKFC